MQRIVAAARVAVTETGFDELTVRGVAQRAGVAPATAYTYFASKNHLVAETFWRSLVDRPRARSSSRSPTERVVVAFRDLAEFLAGEAPLAAATTAALLAPEPDVKALQVMVGQEIHARVVEAAGPRVPAEVLDALALAWNGAMLQAGMGFTDYRQMGDRLESATRLIMGGRR